MKPLRIIPWILIGLSLIFKFMHYPFNGPLIVLGAFLLFIHAIIYMIKNLEVNISDAFFHMTLSIWTIYLMFRYMYWPFAQFVFIMAACITFAYIILLGINKSKIQFSHIMLSLYVCAAVVISYTPSHHFYYFFNLNTITNSEQARTLNYAGWDKYSWFLYGAKEKEAALKANQNAQKAVEESLKLNEHNEEAAQFSIYIQQNKQHILEQSWTNYTRPY